MKLYGGIDLHSNNSVIALLDEASKPVLRERLANDLNGVLRTLEPFQESLEALAVESTYNWYWLVDGLQEAGYRVHLANTAAIVRISHRPSVVTRTVMLPSAPWLTQTKPSHSNRLKSASSRSKPVGGSCTSN